MILATIGLYSCQKEAEKQVCTTCTKTYDPSLGISPYTSSPYCATQGECVDFINSMYKLNDAQGSWTCTNPQ